MDRINTWNNYEYELYSLLNTESVASSLSSFWSNILEPIKIKYKLDPNKELKFYIQFKIKNTLNDYTSISYLQYVNSRDYLELCSIFNEFWNLKEQNYQSMDVTHIVYTYKFILEEKDNNIKSKFNKVKSGTSKEQVNDEKDLNYLGYNLPNTMDFSTWGECLFNVDYSEAIVFKPHSKVEYIITLSKDKTVVKYLLKDKLLFTFTDYILDYQNLNTFKRVLKNQTYFFELGKLKLKKVKKLTNFITKLKPSINLNENYITMDLETRKINNTITPYCISIYDGSNINNFYLDDFETPSDMLNKAIFSLLRRKYNNYRVYLHNLSTFDGVFLLKILSKISMGTVPVIKDNKIIEIKFKYGKYTLFFRDSYLLLPVSLSSLTESFNVDNKLIYPIFFLDNEDIKLNYSGAVPSFKYFNNLTKKEYRKYCERFNNKEWNLKNEALSYCNQDVVSLYKVISFFANFIFDLFRIDIYKYPTLPSLAFAIFRAVFLKDSKIPIITGNMYNFMKKAYTGGNVDVYKPIGVNLFYYDINSLYPYVMRNYEMPVGQITYFEGDIFKYEKKPFGIFKVKIKTPNNLNIPLLQKNIFNQYGFKTITPLGNWTGYYTSIELEKAKEIGYEIEIIKGYLFEQKIIFKDYVDFFHSLKNNNKKGSPAYLIAKFFMNTAYGKLAMKPEMEIHKFIKDDEVASYNNKYTITNILNIEENLNLISFLKKEIKDFNWKYPNISVPIAAFISGIARVIMFKYKNIKNNPPYYTDTDSIVLGDKLPENLVDKKLGFMQLEHEINLGIFVAPKLYCLVTNLGFISKAKGLKLNNLTLLDYLKILEDNSNITVYQDKWYRNLSKGEIKVNNEKFNIKITDGKRELIHNELNQIIDTKPLIINET